MKYVYLTLGVLDMMLAVTPPLGPLNIVLVVLSVIMLWAYHLELMDDGKN